MEHLKQTTMEKEERWYRADFTATHNGELFNPESEYFTAKDDEQAIEKAKEIKGFDYADIGHVKAELTYVALVDHNTETFEEIKPVWW